MIRYFTTAGDKHGWAIDEDLRLMRRSLDGVARETGLAAADVVHAPFWPPLAMHDRGVLRRRFVIAQADNPPFFYLTQPDFAWGQSLVDLWVARSTEAHAQFRDLGLNSIHIPYAIDGSVFSCLGGNESLRTKYGLPRDAYIIGNFHRDSEGCDLAKPKLQKAPEMMLAVLRKLQAGGAKFHVLLAGPRRHWLRSGLRQAGIPFTFIGRETGGNDDFGVNILSRAQLNELYNACDLYLIPSRWEGGPQSAMEAAATRTKILGTPLGVARDILDPECLFDTAGEAAGKILRDMRSGWLGRHADAQEERVRREHTGEAMARHLRALYTELPLMPSYVAKSKHQRPRMRDALRETRWHIQRRISPPRLPRSIRLVAGSNCDDSLGEATDGLRAVAEKLGIVVSDDTTAPLVAAGVSGQDADFRLLPVGGEVDEASDTACHIAMAVQDAVNFRQLHPSARVVVCPLVAMKKARDHAENPVIEPGDRHASHRIWKAMQSNAVSVYPEDSAYYYQVFHGGIGYGHRRTREEAMHLAAGEKDDFTEMARPPSLEAAASFWRQLLAAH